MKPSRIVHLGKYFPPEYGGIESVTNDLARGSTVNGRLVEVICFYTSSRLPKYSTTNDGVVVRRFKQLCSVFSQPFSVRYFFYCFFQNYRKCILHVHMPNVVAMLAVLSAPWSRSQIVVHWHSDIVSQRLLGYIVYPLVLLLLKRAKAIVATSEQYVLGSNALMKYQDKVRIIPIGIEDVAQNSFSVTKSSSYPVLDKSGYILAVGRLVKYKGFDALIKAYSKSEVNRPLVIIGKGVKHRELLSLVRALRLEKKVHFVDSLDYNELLYTFSKCAFFVLPSRSRAEAFGVVQLEAMSFGKPVISTNIKNSGVPWVNRHMESGIVVPVNSEDELSSAIRSLDRDGDLRSTLGSGARSRFLKEFHVDKMNNRFEAVYNELSPND